MRHDDKKPGILRPRTPQKNELSASRFSHFGPREETPAAIGYMALGRRQGSYVHHGEQTNS